MIRRLIAWRRSGAKIAKRFGFQNQLRRDRRSVLAAVKTDAGTRTLKQHRHRHDGFLKRRKTEIPRIAALLVIENSFLMLSDDFPFRIFFDHDFLHWLASFRIDYGHILLRRARLAASANPRGNDRRHGARASSTFGYHVHDSADRLRLIARQHLTKHLRRPTHFDLRLHQTAIEIRCHGNQHGHLKRRHLGRVALPIAFVH